jgi:hypothetical protein
LRGVEQLGSKRINRNQRSLGSKAMMAISGSFGNRDQLDVTSWGWVIWVDLDGNRIAAMGDMRGEFRSRRLNKRIGWGGPPIANFEMQRHVRT